METTNTTFEYDGREISPYELLPEILKPVKDFKALCNDYAVELEKLYKIVKETLDNQFVETASESTIQKFEKRFGIVPNGTDTLDERKFRVLARLSDSPPYTDKYLEARLDALCGKGLWRSHKDYTEYTLVIEVSLDSVANTETVINNVKNIIPANLNLVVRNYRSRHSELGAFTHDQLAAYTQDEIKYAEMFK